MAAPSRGAAIAPAATVAQVAGESRADIEAAPETRTPKHKVDTAPLMGTTHTRFTVEEIAQHNTPDDCWLAAHGVVYDVTSYIALHPGGRFAIVRHGGQVCDSDFDFHSPSAQRLDWSKYRIGRIEGYRHCAVM